MHIDYNKLFFRDTNVLYFTTTDTGKRYKAYVAGVFTQTFGIIEYELGVYAADWMDIYNNLEYAEVKDDKWATDDGAKVMTRSAECPISIEIPRNSYTIDNIVGKVSNFRQKRDSEFEDSFFDCLGERGFIDPKDQGELRALQIGIDWADIENLDKSYKDSETDGSSIFTKIDID